MNSSSALSADTQVAHLAQVSAQIYPTICHANMGMAEWVLSPRPARLRFVLIRVPTCMSSAGYVHTAEPHFSQYNTAHYFENHAHSLAQNGVRGKRSGRGISEGA